MGSDSMPLAPGVPFPPSLHFLTVHRMGRLRPHESESRMFGDPPFGPIGKTNPARPLFYVNQRDTLRSPTKRLSQFGTAEVHRLVRVGSGLDDAEALAIIDQMLVVYPFPKKDKALEYMDLNT
jgi:hypothetical protein